MPSSIRLLLLGALIGAAGAVVALALWRVGGIVILMIGAAVLLAARFRRDSEISAQRRAGRPPISPF